MRHKKTTATQKTMLFVALLGLVLSVTLSGCGPKATNQPGATTEQTPAGDSAKPSFAGKKVLYIDAYHEGYAWSDGITKGVKETLAAAGIEHKVISLDTKRNPSEKFKQQAALTAKQIIDEYKPDVVIGGDDNTSAYVWVPYYKDSNIPFVFCGLNWDASIYNFGKNVTGMLEVASIPQLMQQMRAYAKGDRLGFLSYDQETPRKEVSNITKKFNLPMTVRYVKTWAEWKQAYIDMQKEVDMLIVDNNSGIADWNAEEAKAFHVENIAIPTGTIYDFMAPYALISYAKVASEQGRWAADAAIKILSGTAASDIAISENKEGAIFLNKKAADKLGVAFSADQMKNATLVE